MVCSSRLYLRLPDVLLGFLVDGQSEFHSLQGCLARVQTVRRTSATVALAAIPPTAPYTVIARVCAPRVDLLVEDGADKVIVLLDQEQRPECAPSIAANLVALIRAASQRLGATPLHVVVKQRCYENWLIADPDALISQPGRFRLSRAAVSSVAPNKADHIDALQLMNRCVIGDYDKVDDSKRIMARADPLRIASNSRSFRRLMRCYGSAAYATQSKRPAVSARQPR